MSGLFEAVGTFRSALDGAKPARYSGEDAAVIAGELARAEKACAVKRAAFAARAAEGGAHRQAGFPNISEWMARLTGETSGKAKAELDAVDHERICE